MNSHTQKSQTPSPEDQAAVTTLYKQILDSWNRRSAAHFAALFDDESFVVGFDGSQMNGPAEIESTLGQIFADHQTAAYVGKVKGVRFLAPEVAILRAVSGMVSPGQTDLNAAVNTIQTLTAVRREGAWRIAAYQNTPAQFHGRPDLSAALTEELRKLL